MAEEANLKQEEAAFQVFIRVRPFIPIEKQTTEDESYSASRKSFNTIQIKENVVFKY